jgi:biopolymer transport protein ExbD
MHKNSRTLASPLGLLAHLKTDKLRFTSAAWMGVGLIALGFTLLGGRFIFAPGIAIDLPSVSSNQQAGLPSSQVLTIGQNNTFFFDGRVFSLENLLAALNAAQLSKEKPNTLLIKGDKNTPLQIFLQVCQQAHEAGFDQVQVATIPTQTPMPWAQAS